MFDFIRKSLIWNLWDAGLNGEIATGAFEMKSMQDLAVFGQLRHISGKYIAEIGAGDSRLLPALAKANRCVAVEKFEGKAGGPTRPQFIPNVQIVPAYLGEHDPLLKDESFDIVFSISVVEHVGWDSLTSFHEDQIRVLKPGGLFIHAIDFYLEDHPSPAQVRRFEVYRDWVCATDGIAPLGPVYDGPCRFSCDLASNPDNVMYRWGRIAPSLIGLRQVAQGVSLLVGGRKRGRAGAA